MAGTVMSENSAATLELAPVPSWQLKQRVLWGTAALFRLFSCPVWLRWQAAQLSVVAPALRCGLGGAAEAAPGVSADAAQRPASATAAATAIAQAVLPALRSLFTTYLSAHWSGQ